MSVQVIAARKIRSYFSPFSPNLVAVHKLFGKIVRHSFWIGEPVGFEITRAFFELSAGNNSKLSDLIDILEQASSKIHSS